MGYALAADGTALLHFAFIAFVVFGAFLGLRSRVWRTLHLTSMTYGVLVEVFYWYCPLTYVEQYLRARSGSGAYDEPFIAHYLNKLIYLDAPQWSLIAAAAVVLGVNGGLYLWWALRERFRSGDKARARSGSTGR